MRNNRWPQLILLSVVATLPLGALPLPAQSVAPRAKAAQAKALAAAQKKAFAYAQNDAAPPEINGPLKNNGAKINAAKINAASINAAGKGQQTLPAVDPLRVAAQVDDLIAAQLQQANVSAAPRCSDEDFLRRVSFDIAGVAPTPQDMTLFGLDPDSNKRAAAVNRLLAGDDYAKNWSRYWHDVFAVRATETRLQFLFPALQSFESWMKSQLAANRPWNEIATALLTATGNSRADGQTALIIAQRAEPAEIAAEMSRVFLGIQIQCANCHDHPTDSWKREQFHSLAAFFPRMQLRPKGQPMPQSLELASLDVADQATGRAPGSATGRGEFLKRISANPDQFIRRFDRNGDHMISKDEARQGPTGGKGGGGGLDRLFEFGDANHDGLLSAAEIKKIPAPPMQPGQGSAEYHMPDLQHPDSEGKKLDPLFFLGNLKPGSGLSDLDRRKSLAKYITSPNNPWFAKALVNRIWGQLVGEGFSMPIDDMGPERTTSHPAAFEALSAGFTSSGYDLAWLFRAITSTAAYQRQIRPRDPKQTAAFASAAPIRLRADQLYDSLTRVLGIKEPEPAPQTEGPGMGMYRRAQTGRFQFHQLFGFDPSTCPEEVTGTIPQALFMMNSAFVNGLIRASGQTRLHQLLDKYKHDDDALSELFILVHARDPSANEAQICRDYIREVDNRQEAFEDILWSLLNSTEFQSKR